MKVQILTPEELQDPDVDIKLARLDVTDLSKVSVFVFRRNGITGVRTVISA